MFSADQELYRRAEKHLSRKDKVLKGLIRRVGQCTLHTCDDYFAVLVRSIVSQQISTKAAASIYARLEQTVSPGGMNAAAVVAASDEALRQAGLSASKARFVRDLAEKVHGRQLLLHELPALSDDDVIAALLPVKGIGRWTAEMFLIFGLGRPDVLPVADLGLRVGVQREYGLGEVPTKQELQELTAPWKPYRSIGTWFIWRTFANATIPQSPPQSPPACPPTPATGEPTVAEGKVPAGKQPRAKGKRG